MNIRTQMQPRAAGAAPLPPRWADPRDTEDWPVSVYLDEGYPAYEAHHSRARTVAESIMAYMSSDAWQPSNQKDWWQPVADFYLAERMFREELDSFERRGGMKALSERGRGLLVEALNTMAAAARMAEAFKMGHDSWHADALKRVQAAADRAARPFWQAFGERLLSAGENVYEGGKAAIRDILKTVEEGAKEGLRATFPWGPVAVGAAAIIALSVAISVAATR